MVQEYQSPVRVYKYPFEIVMAVSNFSLYSFYFLGWFFSRRRDSFILIGNHLEYERRGLKIAK